MLHVFQSCKLPRWTLESTSNAFFLFLRSKINLSLRIISKSLVATSLKPLRESSTFWSSLMSLKLGKRTLSPSHVDKLALSVSLSCQSKKCNVDLGSKGPLYNFKSATKVIKKDSSSFFEKAMLTEIFFFWDISKITVFEFDMFAWFVPFLIVCKLAKRREL